MNVYSAHQMVGLLYVFLYICKCVFAQCVLHVLLLTENMGAIAE